jgi:hypothetical protein
MAHGRKRSVRGSHWKGKTVQKEVTKDRLLLFVSRDELDSLFDSVDSLCERNEDGRSATIQRKSMKRKKK